MIVQKINLSIKSGLLTALHADTIFGHLCWVIAHRDGEDVLIDFLKSFSDGNPPFVISNAFPEGYFPKPLSADFLAVDLDKIKNLRKTEWVPFADFEQIRKAAAMTTTLSLEPTCVTVISSTYNRINRLTNTVASDGGVYSLKEMVIPEVCIYLKTISDAWRDRVLDLFTALSHSGFGRKKSIGKGQFKVKSIEEVTWLNRIEDANGFVSLSNFCPKENDPTEGLYKLFVKYGKLGEEFTFCGNPFKRPLVMIKAGSVFKTEGPPKEYYGRMVEKIAPAKESSVVQYAYAFTVPIKYPQL